MMSNLIIMQDGFTPLTVASYVGHKDVVARLLKANATPDIQGEVNHCMCYTLEEMMKALVDILKVRNFLAIFRLDSHTILAVMGWLEHPVQILPLEKSFHLRNLYHNCYNNIIATLYKEYAVSLSLLYVQDGLTVLMIATKQGHRDIVSLLLQGGASPNITEKVCMVLPSSCLSCSHCCSSCFYRTLDGVRCSLQPKPVIKNWPSFS